MGVKSMELAWIGLAVAVLAVLALILRRMRRDTHTQEELVRRVRTTDLYGHVYPLLRKYDTDLLEGVVFRPEHIIVRMLEPLGTEVRYTYARHEVDDPEQITLYALAQAALVDMKVLRDTRHYTFVVHRSRDRNGNPYTWYEYAMRSKWKKALLQAQQKKRLAARTF